MASQGRWQQLYRLADYMALDWILADYTAPLPDMPVPSEAGWTVMVF